MDKSDYWGMALVLGAAFLGMVFVGLMSMVLR